MWTAYSATRGPPLSWSCFDNKVQNVTERNETETLKCTIQMANGLDSMDKNNLCGIVSYCVIIGIIWHVHGQKDPSATEIKAMEWKWIGRNHSTVIHHSPPSLTSVNWKWRIFRRISAICQSFPWLVIRIWARAELYQSRNNAINFKWEYWFDLNLEWLPFVSMTCHFWCYWFFFFVVVVSVVVLFLLFRTFRSFCFWLAILVFCVLFLLKNEFSF